MSIYDYDRLLPPLPIPELADTCENLKEMTKPLLDTKEWTDMCAAAESFQHKDGKALQRYLLQWKAEQEGNSSWLRPVWDDNYLSFRDRLPINMNYTFQLKKDRWGNSALPKLLHGLCHILNGMRTETLPAEKLRETPLSMEALSHMIYTRIPDTVRDTLYYPPLSASYTAAVVCRGYWFLLSLTDVLGDIHSPEALQRGLDKIRQEAEQMPETADIGALTCAPRTEAADLRRLLQSSAVNRINLQSLENSVCVICLDETNSESFMRELIIGSPANRWFDKSIQFICNDTELGINFEHSGCDAGIWVYLLSLIDEYAVNQITPEQTHNCTADMRPLRFHIAVDIADQLKRISRNYAELSRRITVGEKKLETLSRSTIKKINCRPDAVVQILYQAAYYKLTGCFRSTYEAVSTRAFFQGRTECVRPCTAEAADFARSFVEKNADNAAVLEKYRLAEQAHMVQIKRCQSGLGAERHMTGLMFMHVMNSAGAAAPPDIFETQGYKTLKHDILSTSSTTAPFIDFFGFGPVVWEGLGIGYGIKSDALHIAVSAYEGSGIKPQEFINTLDELGREFCTLAMNSA